MILACRSRERERPHGTILMCRRDGPARPCRIVSAPGSAIEHSASWLRNWRRRGWRSRSRGCGCAAGGTGRRAFVSGKKRQNTGKATAVSDGDGRLLWLGAFRPGRMHDVTALRTEGIEDLLRRHPDVRAEVDTGYQGLARDFPGQVSAPPKKPGKNAPPEDTASWEQRR